MKFIKYMLKYYFRNPLGFFFILCIVMIVIFLFSVLESISSAFEVSADESRIVIMNDVTLHWGLPLAYKNQISQVEGVEILSFFHIAVGVKDPNEPPVMIASIEPDNFFKMSPEISVDPQQLEQFKQEQNACIIGINLYFRYGWKPGDTVSLKIANANKNFEFVVRGIYSTNKLRENELVYCHYKYHSLLDSSIDGKVFSYMAKVKDVNLIPSVTQKIDQYFENSFPSTRSQPERVFASNMQATEGNFGLILRTVGAMALLATLLVLANTMIMGTRQMMAALITLRLLGYPRRNVQILVLFESLFVCVLGGAIVCFFIWLRNTANPNIELIIKAMILSISLGLLTGVVPALMAGKTNLAVSLRKIV